MTDVQLLPYVFIGIRVYLTQRQLFFAIIYSSISTFCVSKWLLLPLLHASKVLSSNYPFHRCVHTWITYLYYYTIAWSSSLALVTCSFFRSIKFGIKCCNVQTLLGVLFFTDSVVHINFRKYCTLNRNTYDCWKCALKTSSLKYFQWRQMFFGTETTSKIMYMSHYKLIYIPG